MGRHSALKTGGLWVGHGSVILGRACTALLLLGLTSATAQTAPAANDRYTPVVQSVPSPPRWFKGADGRIHLVYELILTNGFPVDVTATSLEVLDADSGDSLATLSGDTLTEAMSLLATGNVPTTTLPASAIGVVWLDLPFADPEALPARLEHRLTVSVPPGLPVPETITHIGGLAEVDRRPPVVFGPPLLGPGWAALGSCCDGPHRRAFQPVNGGLFLAQRFAIDFNKIDDQFRFVDGDPNVNESYPTYGQLVIAVADATVVAAADRWPDQTPLAPRPVTLEEADGNYVILDLGDGRFAFYAHLKPGSVLVAAGQQVRRGEVLGQAGNSGSSTGPHLHFHLMDGPSALAADGLPYVFNSFEITGRTPPLEELFASDPTSAPVALDTQGAGPQRGTLPAGRDVMTFPDETQTQNR